MTPEDREETYVMGTSVPAPPPGQTYRLWAIGPDGATYIGDFTPINGVVALEIRLDPTTLELRVTVEPVGLGTGLPRSARLVGRLSRHVRDLRDHDRAVTRAGNPRTSRRSRRRA